MKRVIFWMIRIGGLGALSLLVFHIYTIQIEKGGAYTKQAMAREQSVQSSLQFADRGMIYCTDKNNNAVPIVMNKEYSVVYAVPKEVQNPSAVAHTLAPLIEKNESAVKAMLSKPNDLYELLQDKATDSQAQAIADLNIKGIYIKKQLYRFYPFKSMAAHVLGYISPADDGKVVGRYGIELQKEDDLQGKPGMRVGKTFVEPETGKDVYLTIDRNIQNEAEKIIGALLTEWKADDASVIVQEPETGKILALANAPTFDPNTYAKYDLKNFINASLQLVYEPGSVFKIITMAAGIDSGKITPQTTYVDTGSVTLNKWTIRNWDKKAYGLQTMTNVIEHSLNLGTMFAQRTMGNDIFVDYVKRFGFNDKTGISLPGEVRGNLRNLDNGEEIDYATASFGQGISVTPLQMISAVSAIANGGFLMKPLLMADQRPEVVRRAISQDTATKVTTMMTSAVEVNKLAVVDRYSVAGKTGTAYIPDLKTKKYSDRVVNTYVGFAPSYHPRFTVLIKLTNPVGAPLAGMTVVPAFRELTEFLLNYYQVPPDKELAPAKTVSIQKKNVATKTTVR